MNQEWRELSVGKSDRCMPKDGPNVNDRCISNENHIA